MRGQHDGRALRDQRAKRRPQRLARLDVEADGRLVEKEQRRAAAHRERELHLALLAGRELAVRTVGQRGRVRERHAPRPRVIGAG